MSLIKNINWDIVMSEKEYKMEKNKISHSKLNIGSAQKIG